LKKTVTVFGSSRPDPDHEEYLLAMSLGRALAESGFVLCNGGYGGIMEASARGAREAGGHTVGITMSSFGTRSPNRWIAEIEERSSLIERMMRLIEKGDAYVILKGGTGTLLELAAVWELMNKAQMKVKPIIVLGTFWNGVVATLKDELSAEGLARCTKYVSPVGTVAECLQHLQSHWR
jgi:hypothetical protein